MEAFGFIGLLAVFWWAVCSAADRGWQREFDADPENPKFKW